jgi:hypothetical protein
LICILTCEALSIGDTHGELGRCGVEATKVEVFLYPFVDAIEIIIVVHLFPFLLSYEPFHAHRLV